MLKKMEPENIERYGKHYDEASLWRKIGKVAKRVGSKVIYPVILLYYVLQDGKTSLKNKAIIIGALGYFILPFDFIPDVLPFLGYADDLAALTACVKAIIDSITPEIKEKAKSKLAEF